MKQGQTMVLAVALLAAWRLAAGAADLAPDWPQWRGPDSDSISRDTDWNPAALTAGVKICLLYTSDAADE